MYATWTRTKRMVSIAAAMMGTVSGLTGLPPILVSLTPTTAMVITAHILTKAGSKNVNTFRRSAFDSWFAARGQ